MRQLHEGIGKRVSNDVAAGLTGEACGYLPYIWRRENGGVRRQIEALASG
jgi:hypothetical protein